MNIIKLYNQYKTYIRCFAAIIIISVTGVLYYGLHGGSKDKSREDIYTSGRNTSSDISSGFSAQDTALSDVTDAGAEDVRDSDLVDAAVHKDTMTDEEQIYVYVYGEVNSPGVVACKKDSRVYEVVMLCGGYSADADESIVNPVCKVSDGQKIYIPYKGEDYSQEIYGDDSYMTSQEYEVSHNDTKGISKLININTATKEQLVTLPGIGASRAEDIISYRSKHGSFKSIEDIKNVSGIKDGAFAKIKDYICV